jgi:tetratricopeptide (TPR) repeat protein
MRARNREAAAAAEQAIELHMQAMFLQTQGKDAEAEACCTRALKLLAKIDGRESPEMAKTLNTLAAALVGQKRYKEARKHAIRAMEMLGLLAEDAWGVDDDRARIQSLSLLGACYQGLGDAVQAQAMLSRALAMAEVVFGPGHPEVASVLNQLAAVYRSTGHEEEARRTSQRALQIFKRSFCTHAPATA